MRLPEQPEYRVLLGGGAVREQAIAEALVADGNTYLMTVAGNYNPGIAPLSAMYTVRSEQDTRWIANLAGREKADYAVIGTEKLLAHAVVDRLERLGIPTVGPTKEAAQLETSKLFLRDLMERYSIPGSIEYHHVTTEQQLIDLLQTGKEYALKPIGLTAGKGVKVMGVQLNSPQEAHNHGIDLIIKDGGLIVEERLIGEEFTLQAFVDGETLVPMPLVQDFKPAYEGNTGPNTGSMGSVSQEDGLLPYVNTGEKEYALGIMKAITDAMKAEGHEYKGIMYGQFMKTTDGQIKLVEINSRFGDPEGANVLSVLRTDFGVICRAIINGNLSEIPIKFAPQATVCKYITPEGYPEQPQVKKPINIDQQAIEDMGVRVLYAQVEKSEGGVLLTTRSRTAALIATGNSVAEAELKVEEALRHVHHRYHLRHDIGKG